jgi:hypothetical protein
MVINEDKNKILGDLLCAGIVVRIIRNFVFNFFKKSILIRRLKLA